MRQILWERGLLTPDMDKDDMVAALKTCEDFAKEKTMLEKRVFDRGHLLVGRCRLTPR